MNLRRSSGALLAGALALTLVAAGEPAAPRGTASTSLTAIDLTVSGVPGVTAVDLGSYASTDTDAGRNVLGDGAPLGWVGVTPLAVGETALGAAEASSNGDGDVTAELIQWSDPAGLVSALIHPVGLTARATAAEALGTAQAATARVDALGQAVGLDVDTTGIVSTVTRTAATATQGLRVDGLRIELGDLVPLDVLALLPIDVLIELLEQLPVGAPDVQAIVDAALGAVGDVEQSTTAITAAGEQLAADLTALADANVLLADARAALDAAQDAEAAAAAALAAADAAVVSLTADLEQLDAAALLTTYGSRCDGATVLTIVSCVEGLLAAAQSTADQAQATWDAAVSHLQQATSSFGSIETLVDGLTEAIAAVVDTLQGLIDDLVGGVADLVDALTTLEGSLGDVVAALADGGVLDVGAIDVGVVATATGTTQTSSATVACNPVPVEVLGLPVATPDCRDPLTAASSLAGSITGAIQGLLRTLPVADGVLPDVSIEVFPTVEERVEQDGAYVTARAHVVPLDVALGSVTIDPANVVSGVLDTLAAQLDALVAAAVPAAADVGSLGLPTTITDALTAARAQLPDVATLQAALADVLASLPDGLDLPTLTTPSIALVVDPTSTASFTSGTAAPGPSPAPGDGPSLPATGGGLALLGLLSLGGAAALRRRR